MLEDEIKDAIALRSQNQPEEALAVLQGLLKSHPDNPQINFQLAWTCDCMGKESEAVPFYESAIENGLTGEDLRGALLGLGSTYRCLGKYKKSLEIFDRAIMDFPNSRSLQIFRALSLYNNGKHRSAIEVLINQLLDTTVDEDIKSYESALRFYSDKLDQTWT